MWLPETAVDMETLGLLSEYGIKFVILAPYQAKRTRKIGAKSWTDASGGKVDPNIPYSLKLPSDKFISVFFYDGPISHDIAFGGLLNNGEDFAKRIIWAANKTRNYLVPSDAGKVVGLCLAYLETKEAQKASE